MNKYIVGVLSTVLLILGVSTMVLAENAAFITSRETGVVVDIIDADAIVVKLNSTGKPAYVRLLGVKGKAGNEAVDYLISNVLGKSVILDPDYSGTSALVSGRWNLLYVYLSPNGGTSVTNKELINETLVSKGYATVDTDLKGISRYSSLVNSERTAKSNQMGVWNESKGSYYYTGNMVNINTATAAKMKEHLTDMPSSLLTNIVDYRKYNPFQTIYDIKFVDGMTKELFDKNRNLITVVTNINRASEKEMKTLIASDSQVDKIIDFRDRFRFSLLTELHSKAGLPRTVYDDNRHFISLTDEESIEYTIPEDIVNINSASLTQITDATDNSNLASKIINYRVNGYTYKTLFELLNISGVNTSVKELHRYTDNLHTMTDINSATRIELRSLFGSSSASNYVDTIMDKRPFNRLSDVSDAIGGSAYSRIQDFIYIGSYDMPNRVNLNTATYAQLLGVGLSAGDANAIIVKTGRMKTASDIPINVSNVDKYVCLYTNINTASTAELRSLNRLSESMISKIIDYRSDQPFGSIKEIQTFFEDNNEGDAYKILQDYLVVK